MVDPEDRGPVFDGVRIGRPATGALLDAGYRAISDLPTDLDGLLALHGACCLEVHQGRIGGGCFAEDSG